METIGTSEMEKLVERRVRHMVSKMEADFKKETGVEPSLSDSEAKNYIKQVIDEVRANR